MCPDIQKTIIAAHCMDELTILWLSIPELWCCMNVFLLRLSLLVKMYPRYAISIVVFNPLIHPCPPYHPTPILLPFTWESFVLRHIIKKWGKRKTVCPPFGRGLARKTRIKEGGWSDVYSRGVTVSLPPPYPRPAPTYKLSRGPAEPPWNPNYSH